MHEIAQRLACQVPGIRGAQNRCGRGIAEAQDAILVDVNGIGAHLDQPAIMLLALSQRRLGFLAVRDVLFDADQVADSATVVTDRGDGLFFQVKAPVFAPVEQFTAP